MFEITPKFFDIAIICFRNFSFRYNGHVYVTTIKKHLGSVLNYLFVSANNTYFKFALNLFHSEKQNPNEFNLKLNLISIFRQNCRAFQGSRSCLVELEPYWGSAKFSQATNVQPAASDQFSSSQVKIRTRFWVMVVRLIKVKTISKYSTYKYHKE